MVTKVRGQFNEFEGSGVVDATDFTKSTVTVTIQAASIDTRNEQRDGHLRSNDFLAMEEYPQITFVSTGIQQIGPTSVELTGDLTIKGVTNTVTIPFEFEGAATDPFGNLRVGFEGSVVINRKDYGVSWNVALETGASWSATRSPSNSRSPRSRPPEAAGTPHSRAAGPTIWS